MNSAFLIDSDAVSNGTFRSVQPLVDELLSIILDHSQSDTPPLGVEASNQVAAQASPRLHILCHLHVD